MGVVEYRDEDSALRGRDIGFPTFQMLTWLSSSRQAGRNIDLATFERKPSGCICTHITGGVQLDTTVGYGSRTTNQTDELTTHIVSPIAE